MNKSLDEHLHIRNIKNELLCYGVRVSKDALSYIDSINPYINNKGIHVAGFYIDNQVFVNVQFNERYSLNSPYMLEYDYESLYLTKANTKICEININPAPIWYENITSNGILMHEVFNVHGNNVLALSNYEGCSYVNKGKKCKFCSFTPYEFPYKGLSSRIDDIIETLNCAFEYNNHYSIALSEGTKTGNDRGAFFFSKVSRAITDTFGNKKISVELAPPSDNVYIDNMINNGVTSIIMNIELFDDNVRRNICPGKSEIPLEHYYKSLSYAVEKLGIGNVSSVLIAGIEPIQNTIKCAKELLQLGVIPTIIPFKPYDDCELRDKKVTEPCILQTIYDELAKEIVKLKFPRVNSHSCIACGACNMIKI